MHRFYIPPARRDLQNLQLDEGQTHNDMHVLRLGPGARVVLFNGQGSEATAEIGKSDRGALKLKLLHSAKSPPLSCAITLGQAVPKGKNMDLIIQKATELGVAAIAPLISERTVTQLGETEGLKKQEKWQSIAVGASKQCGQNWLPTVLAPEPMKKFLGATPRYDLMLIASLQPDARPLKTVVRSTPATPWRSVLILVGPEGDFTPAETALARSCGCQPVTLGPIILRTETAALFCLSALSYELLG